MRQVTSSPERCDRAIVIRRPIAATSTACEREVELCQDAPGDGLTERFGREQVGETDMLWSSMLCDIAEEEVITTEHTLSNHHHRWLFLRTEIIRLALVCTSVAGSWLSYRLCPAFCAKV
jgi:hypothetical protein